jgi:hypothetical protein
VAPNIKTHLLDGFFYLYVFGLSKFFMYLSCNLSDLVIKLESTPLIKTFSGMLEGSRGSLDHIIRSADAPFFNTPFELIPKALEKLLVNALIAPPYDIPFATATPAPCLMR